MQEDGLRTAKKMILKQISRNAKCVERYLKAYRHQRRNNAVGPQGERTMKHDDLQNFKIVWEIFCRFYFKCVASFQLVKLCVGPYC